LAYAPAAVANCISEQTQRSLQQTDRMGSSGAAVRELVPTATRVAVLVKALGIDVPPSLSAAPSGWPIVARKLRLLRYHVVWWTSCG
jgi:hypothetical protein